MTFISVTRLHVRAPRFSPAFAWYTIRTIWQTINTPGFLGGKLMRDAHGGSWTLTLWENQAAMQQFRNTGTHRKVMPQLQKWCDEAVVGHWQLTDTTLPSWSDAHQQILSAGHFTKLIYPSAAQLEHKVPTPTGKHRDLSLRPRRSSIAANQEN